MKYLILGAVGSALIVARTLAENAPAIAIGEYAGPKAVLLAIDDYSLPLKSNLCYYMSKPAVRAEPVLTPSRDNPYASDTQQVNCYASVLHEGGKFRMWYYGAYLDKNSRRVSVRAITHEGPICYAESVDGLHWVRPKLGQVEFRGRRDNNIIALPATDTEGVHVIRDDADPDPSRRYKMVYENTSDKEGPAAQRVHVDTAVSADGLTWKATGTAAWLLEPSSFYRFNGLYWINAQNLAYVSEGGHQAGRQGFTWVSPDFIHWLPEAGESFLLPEPSDPNNRGPDRPYVQVHLGVGAFSYDNVLVGIYCQWHTVPNAGDWFGFGTTFGDFGLLVSNDGQHFREPVKGYVFLSRHASRPAVRPDLRTEEVLTHSGNSILNVGDETWIYHGRWMNTENPEDRYIDIGLATLPRDRWGALGLFPRASEGAVWTAPMTLGQAGCKVALNAEGAAGIRVEIADEKFHLLPEYSGDNAGTAAPPDGLACSVSWPRASIGALTGRKVRLLVLLKRGAPVEPRLFAIYITGGGLSSAR